MQPGNGGALLGYEPPSPPLQTPSSHFIDGTVHRASHYVPTSGTICAYTYDTIYVLSCVGCDGEIYMCTLVT